MPRAAVTDNNRVALRIRSADKAKVMRAAALEQSDLTDFILRHTLRAADLAISNNERVSLSARDSALVLDLLDNPPVPNANLLIAAQKYHGKP